MRPIAIALVVCSVPFTAGAKPLGSFEFIVAGTGDQVTPAINGQYVVYAGPGADGTDVFLYDIQQGISPNPLVIAGGAGNQDSPRVFSQTAIFRDPKGIVIETWSTGNVLLGPVLGGTGTVSNPVVHSGVAAWELATTTGSGMDVVVVRGYSSSGTPYVLDPSGGSGPAGDQRGPSVYGDLVAYIDDAKGGSVWLHDASKGKTDASQVCAGKATGVSIGFDAAASQGSAYVVAVARSGASGDVLEVYEQGNAKPLATLSAPGSRNPHLFAEWVAFDDTSGATSQVVVWRWKTPPGGQDLVFVPHPTQTQQRLNDISMASADEVRVVFEDSASAASGRDIALYRLPVNPLLDDGTPNGWPITPPAVSGAGDCRDPNAVPLATLELVRLPGKPGSKSVEFDVTPPAGSDELPVLVCVRSHEAAAAWVGLGDDAVATPADFSHHDEDLSIPAEVEGPRGRLWAVLASKPGATLTVRVLADPGRAECHDDGEDDHDRAGDDDGRGRGHDGEHGKPRDRAQRRRCHGAGTVSAPSADAAPGPSGGAPALLRVDPGGGCGNAAGLLSLLPLAVLLARRKLRV